MKPQFIIGVKTKTMRDDIGLKNGLSPVDIQQIVHLVQPGVVIGQRDALETDETVLQIIPGLVLSQFDTSAGVMKYVPFRRTKLVGESRLAGAVSVMFGGHIDLGDVIHHESVVNLVATIGQAIGREVQEEVRFSGMDGNDLSMFSVGVLLDDSDSVGRVHMGVIMNAQLPDGATALCAEEELESMAPMSARELLDSGLPLENWTRIILEFMYDVEQMA